jgi:hypothetical protein
MRLKEYSDFLPEEKLTQEYRILIDKNYQVIDDKSSGYKIVLIDDRLYYLSGPYGYKNKLVNKIFFDMNYDREYHEPSLRKAIKDWIDDNSK